MVGDDLSRPSGAAVYVRLYIVASFSSSYFSLAKRSRGRRSFVLCPPLFFSIAWRYPTSLFLCLFHVMTPSSFIIYSIPRFSPDDDTFQPVAPHASGKNRFFFVSRLFMWKLSSNANRFWQNSLQNPENDITWSLDYVDDIRKIFLCGEDIKMYRLMRNFFYLQNRKLY